MSFRAIGPIQRGGRDIGPIQAEDVAPTTRRVFVISSWLGWLVGLVPALYHLVSERFTDA